MIRAKEPAKAKPAAKPPTRKGAAKAKRVPRKIKVAAPQFKAAMITNGSPDRELQTCPSCNGTGKRPVPMTAAERKRRSRANQKKAAAA